MMLAVVYFAIGFVLLRPALATREPDDIAKVASWLGLSVVFAGGRLVRRLVRLRIVAWLIVFLGLCLVFGGLLGAYGVAVAVAVMIGIAVALVRQERAEAEALLWTMAIAAGHGMPLAPGVRAFAAQSAPPPTIMRSPSSTCASTFGCGTPIAQATPAKHSANPPHCDARKRSPRKRYDPSATKNGAV